MWYFIPNKSTYRVIIGQIIFSLTEYIYRKPRSKYHVHDIKLISHHELYVHKYLLIHIEMGGVYDLLN